MTLKRKADFEILQRIDDKQDTMMLDIAGMKKDIASLDKSINQDNGGLCIKSRVRGCEKSIEDLQTNEKIVIAKWSLGAKIAMGLGAIPGGILVIIEIGKALRWIKP